MTPEDLYNTRIGSVIPHPCDMVFIDREGTNRLHAFDNVKIINVGGRYRLVISNKHQEIACYHVDGLSMSPRKIIVEYAGAINTIDLARIITT